MIILLMTTVSLSQPIPKTVVPLSRKAKNSSVVSTLTYILCSKPYSEDKKQGSHQSAILTESLETFDVKPFRAYLFSLRDINTTVSTWLECSLLMSESMGTYQSFFYSLLGFREHINSHSLIQNINSTSAL